MECLIGIKGRDFVLMATDCVAGRSIIAMKKGVHVLYSILLVMHHSTVRHRSNDRISHEKVKPNTFT